MEEYEQHDSDTHMSPVIEIWEEIEEDSQQQSDQDSSQIQHQRENSSRLESDCGDGGNSGNENLKVNDRGSC